MTERMQIKDFQDGVGASPYTGFAIMRGLDAWSTPGICKPLPMPEIGDSANRNDDITVERAGITRITSKYCIDDKNVFEIQNNGELEIISDGQNFNPNDLVIWKNYLLMAEGNEIHAYGPLGDYPDWTDMDTGAGGEVFLHFHNRIYIGEGENMRSLKEDTTFDPSDSNTFTVTENVLILPDGHRVKEMVEFNNNIYIGTSSVQNTATILVWDSYSPSFFSSLKINEDEVNMMIVSTGKLYIQAGGKGNWYYSNGVSIVLYKEMPNVFGYDGNNDYSIDIRERAVSVKNGVIYFGITASVDTDADNFINRTSYYSGVWALDTYRDTLYMAHIPSRIDIYGIDNVIEVNITDVQWDGDALFVGWYLTETDNTEHTGIDVVYTDGDPYGDDNAYLISPYYQFGTLYSPYMIKAPEVHLTKPIESNEDDPQNIKFYYRTDPTADWIHHATLDTVGKSHFVMNNITNLINAQFKVVLNGNVELLKVLL